MDDDDDIAVGMLEEIGLKQAFRDAGRRAIQCYGQAAMLDISWSPDLASGAAHYRALGAMWERYAALLLAGHPMPPQGAVAGEETR